MGVPALHQVDKKAADRCDRFLAAASKTEPLAWESGPEGRSGGTRTLRFGAVPRGFKICMLAALVLAAPACNREAGESGGGKGTEQNRAGAVREGESAKVTFVELGSVRCIPCKRMQPIMKEIEEEYRGQVKVVFYDVWTEEGKPRAQQYRIRVIPTQVFLDKDGKEYFRHEGFFPKEELIRVLEQQGVR